MACRLVLVGGGKMGEALLGGLLRAGWASADELAVVEVVEERRAALTDRFPGITVLDALASPVDGAVVAVKPTDVPAACRALAASGVGRVLSIAAGVTTASLEANLAPGTAVVRAMPNTPALVGAGASAVAAGASATPRDLAWARSIVASVGTVVEVPEYQLDAVTGLSGSGPAYVFLIAEALVDAGVLVGLSREVSVALTTQLLVGSAKLLAESPASAEQLRAQVTSPGGTTAAGLRALERAAVRAAVLDAVEAATQRSRELGK